MSEAYKELGRDFDFPIKIKNPEGRETYYEDGNGFWRKSEYDANGNWTYYKDSDGDWQKSEFDADSNETYYEDCTGFWRKREYDSKGKCTYYENSYGYKVIEMDGKKYKLTEL